MLAHQRFIIIIIYYTGLGIEDREMGETYIYTAGL